MATFLLTLWAHPWGRTILIGTGLCIWGITKGWSWAMAGRDAAIARAITDRDTYWEETVKQSNKEHEYALRKAREEANAVRPARDRDELVRLCRDPQGGSDCREKELHRMPGVRKGNVVR